VAACAVDVMLKELEARRASALARARDLFILWRL
jgi:hypothetical protein